MNRRKSKLNSRRSSPKRNLGIFLTVLVVIAIGLVGLHLADIINLPFLPDEKSSSTPSENNIDYGPPTEEELQETEEFKNQQGDSSAPNSPQTGQKLPVTPLISSWGFNKATGDVEVSGYVPGVIEDGGTCTLTLIKSGATITESKTSASDAQNTSCGLITVHKTRLSVGSWTATLTYNSEAANGVSQAVTIEVE